MTAIQFAAIVAAIYLAPHNSRETGVFLAIAVPILVAILGMFS